MYNLDGLYYRLWGVCGFVALIGILCLGAGFLPGTKDKKGTIFAGVLSIVVSLGMSIQCISIIRHPSIQIYEGHFVEQHRNSRVAPPLPVTYEYTFVSEDGKQTAFYLDLWSKDTIFPEDFEKDIEYQITYESQTQIIVGVESIST